MSDELEAQQPGNTHIPSPSDRQESEEPARPPSVLQGHLGAESAQIWASAFLIAILGVIAYSNAFSIPFHSEELRLFSQRPTPSGILLSNDGDVAPLAYPMARLTLALNWWFTPLSPVGFRALNLVLHLGTSVLLFLFAYRALARYAADRTAAARVRIPAAMVAGMVFAVHPALTMSLNQLSERAAVLTGFAMVVCLLAFLRVADGDRPSAASMVLMLLGLGGALASGEAGYGLPVLLLAADWLVYGGAGMRRRLPLHAFAWGGLLIVLAARWAAAQDSFRFGLEGVHAQTDAMLQLLPVAFTGRGLSMLHTAGTGGAVPLVILGLLLLVGAAFTLWRSLAGFAALWFAVVWMPGMLFAPALPVVSETQLYVPMLGLVLLAPWLFATFLTDARLMRLGGVAAAALIVAAGVGTFLRNSLWADEYELWRDTLEKAPGSPEALLRLGTLGVDQAEAVLNDLATGTVQRDSAAAQALRNQAIDGFETAENTLRQARKLRTDDVALLFPLGISLARQDKADEAIEALRGVLAIEPEHQEATLALATVYHERSVTGGSHADLLTAIDYFQRAARLGPLSPPHQAAWGVALAMLGDIPAGVSVLRSLAATEPEGRQGPYSAQLTQLESAMGQLDSLGKQAQELATTQGPGSPAIALIRSQESILLKQYLQAFYLLDRFLALLPGNPAAWSMMGYVKAAMGDPQGFLNSWGRAVPLDLAGTNAWMQLARTCAAYNRWGDARLYLESPAAGASVPNPLTALGDIALEFGLAPQAVAYYREATEMRPEDPAPWLKLFEIAIQSADRTTARGYLREAERRGAPESELAPRRDKLGSETAPSEEEPELTVIR